MVIYTRQCAYCGETFGYDAPPRPKATPEYCSSNCKRSAEYEANL